MTQIAKSEVRIAVLRGILYAIAFADAEIVRAEASDLWGMVFYSVICLGLVLHSTVVGKGRFQGLLLCASLIALIRIVTLAMAIEEYSGWYWYVILDSIVFAGIFIAMRTMVLQRADLSTDWKGFRLGSIDVALIYLAAITIAELITAIGSTTAGMVCHAILLFSLVLNSSMLSQSSSQKLYLALALAPLIRIVSLAMPMEEIREIYQYLFTSALLFLAVIVVIRILNLRRPALSLNVGKLPVQLLVALTGVGFGVAEYCILEPEPLIDALTWQEILVPTLIFVVAVGFVEELAFRGVIQHCSTELMGRWGWVYVAVLFAVLHIGYESVAHWFFILGVGLFFGWVVKKTGSLLGVTLSHGLANIGLFLVVPHVI
ncbi:MAG: CPBP family intramembrane metalloprotease [Chloroflexi bacterium]|nr:CPBP family intramembrane metalloprotease [Chloroflexota bacterium]